MGNPREINRHRTALSQTRALAVFVQYMALCTGKSRENQRADAIETAHTPQGHQLTRQRNTNGRLPARRQVRTDRIMYRPRPVFHTYLLTWL